MKYILPALALFALTLSPTAFASESVAASETSTTESIAASETIATPETVTTLETIATPEAITTPETITAPETIEATEATETSEIVKTPKTVAHNNGPTTTIVALHADWCSGCKVLGAKMSNIMNALDEDTKAKFTKVKFDFTNDTTKAATKAMAEEKGLIALYPKGKPSTGVLKIIDNETGAVLARIHYKMSEEEIMGALKAVISRS